MTVSKVTNEWLEAEIDHHDNMAAITAANGRAERSEEHDAYAAALRELLAIRAADEGAVTVEGFADMRVLNDGPWNTLRGAANMLRVFMEGIDGDIPVTVTIRKAKP